MLPEVPDGDLRRGGHVAAAAPPRRVRGGAAPRALDLCDDAADECPICRSEIGSDRLAVLHLELQQMHVAHLSEAARAQQQEQALSAAKAAEQPPAAAPAAAYVSE